jgi:hypothetical protein
MGVGHQRVKPDPKRADGPRRIGAGAGDHVASSFPPQAPYQDHTMDNKGAYDVDYCIKGGTVARVKSFPALSQALSPI